MSAMFTDLGAWGSLAKETRIAVINQARREGMSAKELGDHLGVTRNVILGFAHRNKLAVIDSATASEVAAAAEKAHKVTRKRGRKDKSSAHAMSFRNCPTLRAKAEEKAKQSRAADAIKPDHPANRDAKLLTLVELDDRSCRWPIEVEGTTHYCGWGKARPTQPYCAAHQAVSNGTWVAPQPNKPIGDAS